MSTWMDLLQKIGFKKSAKGWYVILFFFLILSASSFYFINGSSSNGYVVTEVIDGDTVVIEGSDNHVRYLDIDAPEILHEDSPGDPLGKEATNLNKSLVLGKKVKLEFDNGKFDAYGRELAYVYVDGVFVNQEIVRNGLARTLIIKPNGKYANIIYEAENKAKRERRGIWGDLDKLNPPSENLNFLIKPSQASRYIDQRVVGLLLQIVSFCRIHFGCDFIHDGIIVLVAPARIVRASPVVRFGAVPANVEYREPCNSGNTH